MHTYIHTYAHTHTYIHSVLGKLGRHRRNANVICVLYYLTYTYMCVCVFVCLSACLSVCVCVCVCVWGFMPVVTCILYNNNMIYTKYL